MIFKEEIEEFLLKEFSEAKKFFEGEEGLEEIYPKLVLQRSLEQLEQSNSIAFDNFMKVFESSRESQLIIKGYPKDFVEFFRNKWVERENYRKNNKLGEYSD